MKNFKSIINNKKKTFKIDKKLINLIKKINNDYTKYYFSLKLKNNKKCEINTFIKHINSELIGKFLNIFIRCTKPIIKNYNCVFSDKILNYELFTEYYNLKEFFIKCQKKKEYSKINNIIIKFSKKINFYLNNEKPWNLFKNEITKKRAHTVYTISINLFLILLLGIKPIIPKISKKIENILNLENLSWENLKEPLLKIKINKYSKIVNKIDLKNL